jgi:Ca-activated chloride channel family protein
MQSPRIELIPSKPQGCSDADVTIDVMVRITPPQPDVHFPRPTLNLALVLDRSGSMAGAAKMPLAHKAAAFAVEQLTADDRISVTIYDTEIETIVPSTNAVDKAAVIHKIQTAFPRGSTNLHGGWLAGAQQVEQHLTKGGINRVLLLTDGLANEGMTEPDAIERETAAWSQRGVSTTTIGLGRDYNEFLLEKMARSSDGNYYYVEDAQQLTDLFQTELQGLMAASGLRVSLGLEPTAGVQVVEVLNDLERLESGRLKLANLIVGIPITVVVRLSVSRRTSAGPLCTFRLAWDDPKRPDRQSRRATLDGRPPSTLKAWEAQTADPAVQEQVALLMSARAQREAAMDLRRGDLMNARRRYAATDDLLSCVLGSPEIDAERAALQAQIDQLEAGNYTGTRKMAHYRAHQRQASKPLPPDKSGDK